MTEGHRDMTVVVVWKQRDKIDVDICLGMGQMATVMPYQMISFGYFQENLVVSKIWSTC